LRKGSYDDDAVQRSLSKLESLGGSRSGSRGSGSVGYGGGGGIKGMEGGERGGDRGDFSDAGFYDDEESEDAGIYGGSFGR